MHSLHGYVFVILTVGQEESGLVSSSSSSSSTTSASSSSSSSASSTSVLNSLSKTVAEHKRGDEVEPITHLGYTKAARKRKRQELADKLDKTIGVGRFAIIDIPNDDPDYKLRLGLVRITAVHDTYIEFQWYRYSGYPKEQNPTYKSTWSLQVLAGKGQKVDTGWCYTSAVVLTFAALTRGKKIPNVKRNDPLKMIARALSGSFGLLPQDMETQGSDSEYSASGSSSCEDDRNSGVYVTRLRSGRGKRHCKR